MSDAERNELGHALGLLVALTAALIGVTCSSRGTLEHGPIEPLIPHAAGAPSVIGSRPIASGAALSSAAPNVALGPSPTVAAPAASPGLVGCAPTTDEAMLLELHQFYADLAALDEHRRQAPVRILWLGDSHTAADYLTGQLRARLQSRFAAAGPGFVRVGMKSYRHSQVHGSCDGHWRVEPIPASRRTPFDDGVFGLGGVRALPLAGSAQTSFEVARGTARGQLHWQVWFSLPMGASFRVTLAGASRVISSANAGLELPGAGFSRLALESGLEDKLELVAISGAPRFYGLVVEGSEPGVVLDTVGIDGARVATALAWDETSFEAAVRERAPSLVALAFGTNEAFDADRVEKYRGQYEALLARVRRSAPDAACLIVGPPDATAVSGGSEPRVVELDGLERSVAAELGCGYMSQLEIMGGPGAYGAWTRQTPQLARGDRLHLSPKGYELVANVIADRLLAAYERRARQ